MNIGIFGGTFNPPHLGHYAVIEGCITPLALDLLLLVPAGIPPHKELPQQTATPTQRVAMLTAMADVFRQSTSTPCDVKISTLEIDRGGKSYTSDTLQELHQQYPDANFYLLLGEDMFLSLQDWNAPQQLADLATLVTFSRGNTPPTQAVTDHAHYLSQAFGAKSTFLNLSTGLSASSTAVRDSIRNGAPHLLPSTYGYIMCEGLYGSDGNLKNLPLEQLRPCALSMLKAKRIRHVLGVEEESERLAKHWGADPELARRAGILHDITKFWTHAQHLACCAQYNYPLDPLEEATDKLLHAKSGACLARDLFGENSLVVDAVAYHTTARGNMTLMDKILYLADYMEPNRDFPEVERLRALCYEDIDQAMIYGLEITLQEMRERGKVTHQNTLDAYNCLTKSKENNTQ